MDIFTCNGGAAAGVRQQQQQQIGAPRSQASGEPSRSVATGGTSSESNAMQLTGASAPGTAASPESGVSPLADAYTKMTSDILAERTLGDFVNDHSGELVRTGE